jgi:hypothetical protein
MIIRNLERSSIRITVYILLSIPRNIHCTN